LGYGYNIFGFDGHPINLSSSKSKIYVLMVVPEAAKPWKNYWN
jgi:hypothetical protein